jgi:hypothetical protein
VPTGLKVVSSGDGKVSLDWSDNTDNYGHYQVYRNDALISDGPTVSNYSDTGLTNGQAYTYRVSAGTGPNYSGWTSPVSATPQASSTSGSGTLLANIDLTNIANGTRAASMDNRGLPALPGLKSTYWNIRSTNSAGTPYAQVETDPVVGKMLHFHVPANYQATDGEATAGAARAEQEPNVANFSVGNVRWIGFWFKVGAAEAASATHPNWNVALQLANGVGSPTLGIEAFSSHNPTGLAVDGAAYSSAHSRHPITGFDWTRWHFIELGIVNLTKGITSPGSRVQLYIDNALVFDDIDWRADTGPAGLGGLLPTGSGSAYPKIGIYGGNTPMSWARDHYYAKFKIGTTRASIAP